MPEETTIETTQATEDSFPATEETEEYILDLNEDPTQETAEVISVEFMETATSNIVHASLFGSFLICGTLVGIFLLRGRYGT